MASTEFTLVAGGPGVAQLYAIDKTAVPWVLGSLLKTFRVTNQTTFAVDANRIWTVTPANEEDSAAMSALNETLFPPGTSVGTMSQRTREHGEVVGGDTTGTTDYVLLVGGPIGDEGADDVRKLTLVCVTPDPTMGGFTQQANNPSNKSVVFKSSKNTEDISVTSTNINNIPTHLGSGALYAATAAETIEAGTGFEEAWVPKAA